MNNQRPPWRADLYLELSGYYLTWQGARFAGILRDMTAGRRWINLWTRAP